MKVKELRKVLKKMPQDAEVYHLWDGEPRTKIEVVYESQLGDVITADFGGYCYSEENNPIGIMGEWEVPEKPKANYHIDTQRNFSENWIKRKYKEIISCEN